MKSSEPDKEVVCFEAGMKASDTISSQTLTATMGGLFSMNTSDPQSGDDEANLSNTYNNATNHKQMTVPKEEAAIGDSKVSFHPDDGQKQSFKAEADIGTWPTELVSTPQCFPNATNTEGVSNSGQSKVDANWAMVSGSWRIITIGVHCDGKE